MFGFIKKIIGTEKSKNDPVRYEAEREEARADDLGARLSLAGNSRTHQEILYYLAEHDPDPAVRKAVAVNKSTPGQANPLLAGDADADVRLALAGRLVKLLPELSADKQSQLYSFAVQALGTLALDEVLKVRKALSSSLKDCAHTPPKIAAQLARDLEREVSEPILLFCAALADDDLLDILKVHPAGWAVEAIATRKMVSEEISQAVIATDNRAAGTALLKNDGAQIGVMLLETIIEKAQDYPEWQNPLAGRKHLSPRMAQKLAAFAGMAVKKLLAARKDFDTETKKDILAVFSRRLDFVDEESEGPKQTPAQRVAKFAKEGRLDETVISDALAMRDKDLVFAALAQLAHTDVEVVTKIFDTRAPKAIVALCWKAELPMRLALRLQQEIGHVPHTELLYPRDGTDYPLTDDEIHWQLEFLGLDES